MGGFTVPPPPGPSGIGTAVGGVLKGLGGLIGGGQANAPGIFSALPASVVNIAQGLLRFIWRALQALGKVFSVLTNVWVRVLRPMLGRLVWVFRRLRRLIEHDIPWVIRYIDRIRRRVLEIYERYTRPMLVWIQRMRRMLLFLRLFGIKWAEKLDARLVQMQAKILYPIRVALEHIRMIEQWLNVIVSAEQLIQETIWGRSVFHYQDPLMRSWTSAVGRPMDPLKRKELYPSRAAVTPEESWNGLREYLRTGGGPLAGDIGKAVRELKERV